MKHLDLFSGIGGFAYAAQAVWGDEYECVGFCEIDPYCQALLKLRYPGVPVHGDIRTVTNASNSGDESVRRERENTTPRHEQVDLITGGFPCQPFSQAGKRRGTSDNRWLWPEMCRVIKEFQPTWVIGENVAGLLSMVESEGGIEVGGEANDGDEYNGEVRTNGVIWRIINDLENLGYEVQPFVIPAVAVNAPHRRDRVWIVANRTSKCEERSKSIGDRSGQPEAEIRNRGSDAPDTRCEHGQQGNEQRVETNTTVRATRSTDVERQGEDAPDTSHERLQGDEQQGTLSEGARTPRPITKCDWDRDWREVAFATCDVRVDDGLPAELDGLKLSKSRHRENRLKALGNAIVPQVAMQIMQAIKSTELPD